MNTELSIDVSNCLNPKVIRLFDTSHYHPDLIVDNYLVEVLPVNKSSWVTFNVAKYFSLVLNSSNLRYKKANDESCLIDLVDGIYEIKQSYKPNLFTVNHFYHLRITMLVRRINSEKEKLFGEKCQLTNEEFITQRDKLRDIEEYAWAAKWQVEECHDKKKGKEMYEFASKQLENYSNECKC